jgi:hypothetical protein
MRLAGILRLVFVVTIAFTIGCSSSNKGKIEGTRWSCVASTVKGNQVPAGAIELEFGINGTLTMRAGPETYQGHYSLGFGNSVTFNLNRELQGNKTHVEQIVIQGDRLTMSDSDGTAVSFERMK